MAKKKKGLGPEADVIFGQGIDALIGNIQDMTADKTFFTVPLASLQPGRYQPRVNMDEGALNEMADSIRQHGVIQPIVVRKTGSDHYEILAGERRFRAAQIAGLIEIPAVLRDVDDQTAAAIALIENMQREDLNPLEEAQGIHRLITDFAFTHEKAAEAVGRSRSTVTNLLRLLTLSSPVQTMLKAGDIDMGHARALLSLEGEAQIRLANVVVAKRLSVRETEKLVSQELQNKQPLKEKTPKTKPADIASLEAELSDLLATRVTFQVNAKGNKGQMRIDFANLDVLDGILSKLRPLTA